MSEVQMSEVLSDRVNCPSIARFVKNLALLRSRDIPQALEPWSLERERMCVHRGWAA